MNRNATTIKRSLSCLSPNGLVSHSLHIPKDGKSALIRSHFLPIVEEEDGNNESNSNKHAAYEEFQRFESSHKPVKMVETCLPESIVASLQIDPAVELLCVDNNVSAATLSTHHGDYPNKHKRHPFPLLALYSETSLWLLKITYSTKRTKTKMLNSSEKMILTGKIASVQEPFEETLLTGNLSTKIIRVRAPISSSPIYSSFSSSSSPTATSNSYNMICPPGCMAMLTSDGTIILNHSRSARSDVRTQYRGGNNFSRTRYGLQEMYESDDDDNDHHEADILNEFDGISYYTTTPIYGLGGDDTDTDPITDFCFGETSQDIFTIYVLQKSGNVYSANPILFDGTAIPRTLYQEKLQKLDSDLTKIQESLQKTSSSSNSSIVPVVLESRMPEKDEVNMDLATLVQSNDYKEAQIRRIKAEKQFLIDSFPKHGDNSSMKGMKGLTKNKMMGYYVTSCINGGGETKATLWPVQLQGPLLFGRTVWNPKLDNNDETSSMERPCAPAMAIHALNCTYSERRHSQKQNLTYVVVGRLNGQVDICALSRVVEGRFGFESRDDASLLDSRIIGCGVILETIGLKEEIHQYSGESNPNTTLQFSSSQTLSSPSRRRESKKRPMLSIAIDSFASSKNEQLIHYISHTGIFTISTSIFMKTLQNIEKNIVKDGEMQPNSLTMHGREGGNTKESSTTLAWSSLRLGTNALLSGAVVCGDPSLGHIMIAQLSTGSMEVVNLTAAQYLHRAVAMSKTTTPHTTETATKSIESISTFSESIAPLLQKVQQSFSSTGKIIGSNLYPKNAGPTNAAFVLETTQKLQKEIVLPLHEIHDKTEVHKKAILLMYQSQRKDLDLLKSMMEKVKENHKTSLSKFKAIEKNGSDLKIQSAAILDASRSIHSKLSQAEYDYFAQLKRWDIQSNKWSERLEKIQNKVKLLLENQHSHVFEGNANRDDNVDGHKCLLDLPEEQAFMCGQLLQGQKRLLKNSEAMLRSVERDTHELMKKKGFLI